MSITKDFEKRSTAAYEFTGSTLVFGSPDTFALLTHARALETMLKKHEWNGNPEPCTGVCPECGALFPLLHPVTSPNDHIPTCSLAKLLEGVE